MKLATRVLTPRDVITALQPLVFRLILCLYPGNKFKEKVKALGGSLQLLAVGECEAEGICSTQLMLTYFHSLDSPPAVQRNGTRS